MCGCQNMHFRYFYRNNLYDRSYDNSIMHYSILHFATLPTGGKKTCCPLGQTFVFFFFFHIVNDLCLMFIFILKHQEKKNYLNPLGETWKLN